MSEHAHFFWDSNPPSHVLKCIESFEKNGFTTHLWTLENIGDLIPEYQELIEAYPQDTFNEITIKDSGIRAFSDIVRFTILKENPGHWWFDTDCYCLRNVKEWKILRSRKIPVAGWESSTMVGSGVLWLGEHANVFFDELQKRLKESKGEVMHYGFIGPQLVTEVMKKNQWEPFPSTFFTPVHWKEIPSSQVHGSFCVHMWNSLNDIDEFIEKVENRPKVLALMIWHGTGQLYEVGDAVNQGMWEKFVPIIQDWCKWNGYDFHVQREQTVESKYGAMEKFFCLDQYDEYDHVIYLEPDMLFMNAPSFPLPEGIGVVPARGNGLRYFKGYAGGPWIVDRPTRHKLRDFMIKKHEEKQIVNPDVDPFWDSPLFGEFINENIGDVKFMDPKWVTYRFDSDMQTDITNPWIFHFAGKRKKRIMRNIFENIPDFETNK